MAERENARANVLRLQRDWIEKKAEREAAGGQLVTISDLEPGVDMGGPPRLADPASVMEVQVLADKEDVAFRAYREAHALYVEGN